MQRTDDDSWDITESVGSTALGVAAARAAETQSAHPLIRDPYARIFLDAVGEGTWNMYGSVLPADIAEADPDLAAGVRAMIDFVACRTAFIDDFFNASTGAGVRQVVILAAGLDSRAWRLPWPEGTRVYELDQPKVLEFKTSTLLEHGAEPAAQRIEVAIDLRQDWPTALQRAGFDASQPTAWSAEGLLRYLPARAQDVLFERIQELSCVDSWLTCNAPSADILEPERIARERDRAERFRVVSAQLGRKAPVDPQDLWYAEQRTEVASWLGEHGWEVSAETATEAFVRHRRSTSGNGDVIPPSVFISARRVR